MFFSMYIISMYHASQDTKNYYIFINKTGRKQVKNLPHVFHMILTGVKLFITCVYHVKNCRNSHHQLTRKTGLNHVYLSCEKHVSCRKSHMFST